MTQRLRDLFPTRRRALLAGSTAMAGAAGAAALAPSVFAPSIVRASNLGERIVGMGVRKEANRLTAESDDVAIYRDTVAWMKARSAENPLDPMGWAQHWLHHSIFCATNTFQFQVHYGWFFFPWRRAYLVNLEQKIRRVANEPAFAPPYWDWTKNRRTPDWMWGEGNPLHNTTRYQEMGDVLPADFVEIGPVMRARDFDHFGGRKRVPGDLQVEGAMEQGAHNNVHNWTGGEMASFDGAGNDPFFQLHHGQVDRIWEMWLAQGEGRANPTDPDWLEHEFWLYGADGLPETTRVADLLDTEAQGYRFDDLTWRSALTPENTPTFDAALAGEGTTLGEIALDDATRASIEGLRRGEGPGRVSLTYERLSLPIQPYQHRLFFVDAASGAGTFVGVFTILPIPDLERGLERTVSSQVEAPPAALDALMESDRVHVIGVGVPLKGRAIPTQPTPFEGVTLTVEA